MAYVNTSPDNTKMQHDTHSNVQNMRTTGHILWLISLRKRSERTHPRDNGRGGASFQKDTERRLNRYGHVMMRDGEHILRKLLRADIPVKRKIGRPKTRSGGARMKSTGLRAGEKMEHRERRSSVIAATLDERKSPGERRSLRKRIRKPVLTILLSDLSDFTSLYVILQTRN